MSRYIDTDVLKEKMLKYGFRSVDQTITEFVEDILPTADVVEVVRCKDCKYYKIDHPRANGYHCCYRMHSIFPMKPDDFCSYGEHKILPKD